VKLYKTDVENFIVTFPFSFSLITFSSMLLLSIFHLPLAIAISSPFLVTPQKLTLPHHLPGRQMQNLNLLLEFIESCTKKLFLNLNWRLLLSFF